MTSALGTGERAIVEGHAWRRLLRVELHKLLDTRGSRVFLGVATLTTLAGMVSVADRGPVLTATGLLLSTDTTVALALPVAAMLATTSEWSPGSCDQLFLLEPRRPRVVAAKAAAVAALGAAASLLVAVLVAGVLAAARLSGRGVDWTVPAHLAGRLALTYVVLALAGLAVGTLLRWPSVGLALVVAAWWAMPMGSWWAQSPPTRGGWLLVVVVATAAVGLSLLLGVRRLVRGEMP